MSKTPITDKIQKKIRVIEKITLPTTMDTGFDNSNFTKNWTQSGEDFEKFFGIDKFKEKYGNDLVIDPSEFGIGTPEALEFSNKIRKALFSTPDVKNHRVSLLHVHGVKPKTVATEGQIVPGPYLWRCTADQLLTEDSSPQQISPVLGDFYRMNPSSDEVSIRNAKFVNQKLNVFFSSSVPVNKLGQFLYSDNNSFPKQLPPAAGTLQTYAATNYQVFLSQAVDAVKEFVKDEESLHDLEQLKSTSFHTLPSFIHDAILVGIADAANTNIYKDNRSKSLQLNKIGCSILQPTQNVLVGLENIVGVVKKEDEISHLTEELVAGLNNTLEKVRSAANPYNTCDPSFLTNLNEAIKLRKWDVEKATGKTTTMLYFALSLIVNQINNAFTGRSPRDDESAFYFGELGAPSPAAVEKRERDLFDKLISSSMDSGTAPMAILKGTANKDDNKFIIEPFVINYSGKEETPKLGSVKQAGLTTAIHNHIYHKAAKNTGPSGEKEATQEEYIEEFRKVQENSSSILNSRYGKNYWLQILKTCYDAKTDKFTDGIFFVGIAPIFWSTVNGKEIYVPYHKNHNEAPKEFKISLPYMLRNMDDDPNVVPLVELPIRYEETTAAAIYYDRVIKIYNADKRELEGLQKASQGGDDKAPIGSVPFGGAGDKKPLLITDPRIKERTKNILESKEYNFVPLSEIRKDLLTELYTKKAEFQTLSAICKNVLGNMIATVGSGFWSVGKEELALYNPWIIGNQKKMFDKSNTSSQIMNAERTKAIKEYEAQ